jgi:hypothetical protein
LRGCRSYTMPQNDLLRQLAVSRCCGAAPIPRYVNGKVLLVYELYELTTEEIGVVERAADRNG